MFPLILLFPFFLMLCFESFLAFLKPLECFKRNDSYLRLPLCVCVFKPSALPVNKCRIVYSMALPPFRLKQSTWCYWFQRIFRDWQLESLHRSVTAFPRKLEKWYSKWGRKESRCHPPKDSEQPKDLHSERIQEKCRLWEPTYTWCELRRLSGLLKQRLCLVPL